MKARKNLDATDNVPPQPSGPDQPGERLGDKIAPRRTGRQYYLEPDRQPRYDGKTKVGRKDAARVPRRGDLKAAFTRPRMPRTPAPDLSLDLEPMRPPVVRGQALDPRLRVDPELFSGQAGTVNPASEDGYVRMRMLIQGEELTVLDSHLVDGPLREGASFPGGYAYDVTVGEELLHAGPVPDLGTRRSFVNPEGQPDQQFHNISQAATNVVTVRVPASVLTADRLRQVQVRLYRLKDEAVATRATVEPLDRRFPAQVRVVASRTGLPRSVLPGEIRRRSTGR